MQPALVSGAASVASKLWLFRTRGSVPSYHCLPPPNTPTSQCPSSCHPGPGMAGAELAWLVSAVRQLYVPWFPLPFSEMLLYLLSKPLTSAWGSQTLRRGGSHHLLSGRARIPPWLSTVETPAADVAPTFQESFLWADMKHCAQSSSEQEQSHKFINFVNLYNYIFSDSFLKLMVKYTLDLPP